jgi:hypothetical protein
MLRFTNQTGREMLDEGKEFASETEQAKESPPRTR